MIQKIEMKGQIVLTLLLLISKSSSAQEIDNYSTLHKVRQKSYTRISYDNDLFVGTDRYYTQGIGVDVFSARLEENPLNILLLHFGPNNRDSWGIQFRTHGCTPTTILSDSVLIGDRPYACVFSFGIVRTSQQKDLQLHLSSQFELGLIGQAALGEEIQTGIHRITKNDLPLGWQHQIQNSPIVNYTIRLEKRPNLGLPNYFHADGYVQAKLGTFQTNLSVGFELAIGRLNTLLSALARKFVVYGYSQTSLTLVGYDASLMGGIINREGYHLKYNELNPLALRQHVGLVLGARHVSFGVDFTFLTKEIKEGLPHSWGGVRLTFY